MSFSHWRTKRTIISEVPDLPTKSTNHELNKVDKVIKANNLLNSVKKFEEGKRNDNWWLDPTKIILLLALLLSVMIISIIMLQAGQEYWWIFLIMGSLIVFLACIILWQNSTLKEEKKVIKKSLINSNLKIKHKNIIEKLHTFH